MIVVAGLDAAVGDGDAMGVAAEIGEDLRGSAERLLGVDDPIDAPHGGQMGGEGGGIGQMREIAEEAEVARRRRRLAGVRGTGGGTAGRAA